VPHPLLHLLRARLSHRSLLYALPVANATIVRVQPKTDETPHGTCVDIHAKKSDLIVGTSLIGLGMGLERIESKPK
jgi:hypothetical protein